MPPIEKPMRRLSVYFTNGEAKQIELTDEDTWDPVYLQVSRPNGERFQFMARAVAWWRIIPYIVVEDPAPKVKLVKDPDPELDLR